MSDINVHRGKGPTARMRVAGGIIQLPLQPSSEDSWLKLHPVLNSHGSWPMTTRADQVKSNIVRNGGPTRPEVCFLSPFMQRRETTLPVPTKAFYSQAQKQPCCLHPLSVPTHLPLSHPFCSRRTYLQKTLREVTSQAQSLPKSLVVKGLRDPLCPFKQPGLILTLFYIVAIWIRVETILAVSRKRVELFIELPGRAPVGGNLRIYDRMFATDHS